MFHYLIVSSTIPLAIIDTKLKQLRKRNRWRHPSSCPCPFKYLILVWIVHSQHPAHSSRSRLFRCSHHKPEEWRAILCLFSTFCLILSNYSHIPSANSKGARKLSSFRLINLQIAVSRECIVLSISHGLTTKFRLFLAVWMIPAPRIVVQA
jgi:hypothetical protein